MTNRSPNPGRRRRPTRLRIFTGSGPDPAPAPTISPEGADRLAALLRQAAAYVPEETRRPDPPGGTA